MFLRLRLSDPLLRVLFLHPFGAYGGATKSLAEMFSALPKGAVQGIALAPPGVAAQSLAAAGLEVISVRGIAQWDDTRFGHYRGLRWLILMRELWYWPRTIFAIFKALRCGPFDLIHCNEITALLPSLVAKRYAKAPLVVHVRSLQRGSNGSYISAWLLGKLSRADAVVAIDEAVRRTLPSDLPVTIIHNGMRAPSELPPGDPVATRLFCVGIIGVLHRSKGVYELVEAIRILRDRGVAVRLLVVGDNVRPLKGVSGWFLRKLDFARDVRGDLEAYVARHGMEQVVEFTGFVSEIRTIYGRTDAVCFPSHLDAPGRPVFEAALFGLPTIVAMKNPTSDVVIPGQTGLCIDVPTPEAIANAIEALALDRARAKAMGEKARSIALARFESSVSADKMLELYRRLAVRHDSSIAVR